MGSLNMDIQAIIDLTKQAGAAIIQIANNMPAVMESKKDGSPLTQADMAAHNILVAGLRGLNANIPIISEESKQISYEQRKLWDIYWLIDPLDGTREFLAGNGEFTVNVALIVNGNPVLGVVMVPASGVIYAAHDGVAFKQVKGGQRERLQVRSVGDSRVVVVMSRRHGVAQLQAFLQRLPCYEALSVGSSLKFCRLAEGKADVYPRLSPTSEWDTAAAQCVLRAAGGDVFDVTGKRLVYNSKESLLNPSFIAIGDSNYPWLDYWQDIVSIPLS